MHDLARDRRAARRTADGSLSRRRSRFTSSQGRPDGPLISDATIRDRPGLGAVSPSRNRRLATSVRTRSIESTAPAYQGLMRYAGLDPDHGLLRWGNFDQTLLLPSTVFEPDEIGRSYRLRPCTDSIWLREVTIQSGVLAFFLVPDRPELRDAIRGTSAIPVANRSSRRIPGAFADRSPTSPHPARHCAGRLFHAGPLHRRRRDAPRMLEARSRNRLKTKTSDPEHGRPRLLARAILLLPAGLCRSIPSPVCRGELLRQRLW